MKKGIVVVASIGNSGANGVYSGGVPGMGDKVIGVASFDNSHVALTTFTVTPGRPPIGYGNAAGGAACADHGQPAAGQDGHADDDRRRLHQRAGARQPDGQGGAHPPRLATAPAPACRSS